MKILLTGKNGMVGWELNRSLLPLGEVIALDRSNADLSRPASLREVISKNKPDVIVNAAAYTAVDKAEEEESLATEINGESPGVLAEEAKNIGALVVHYSTDYVFDGTKQGAYLETDTPIPVNAYGRSKLAGEQAIQASGADYLIFRTSWVYAARGHNFLLTMLRLMREREELGIVADQIGAPTWARTIADTTAYCICKALHERKNSSFESGIFNLTNRDKTSWHGFAEKILDIARSEMESFSPKIKDIRAITSAEFPTPATRPENSCLSVDKISQRFNVHLPLWYESLMLSIKELESRN